MTHQPRLNQRLPRWHARSIYAGFALLLASGLGWLWLHHFVTVAGPFGPYDDCVHFSRCPDRSRLVAR